MLIVLDEEQGNANDGNETVDALSGLEMLNLAEDGIERAGGGMGEQSGDGCEGGETGVVRIGEGVRTDTGVTLVGDDDMETKTEDHEIVGVP